MTREKASSRLETVIQKRTSSVHASEDMHEKIFVVVKTSVTSGKS